jgi:hypothetical protein
MRHLHLISLLAVLLAAAGSSAGAENRIEFLAMRDETRIEGSEVCFFPADRDDGFFSKFLSTNDVRCMSADAVLALPPGLFNVFARSGSTLVSSHPVFIDNSNPGDAAYRAVSVSLLPAATLDVSVATAELREGEWLAIYLSNEGLAQSPAAVRPVPDGAAKVVVPAGMTLVPLVVRSGVIERVGSPLSLQAGTAQALAPPERWGAGRDVVALLRTDALTSPELPDAAPAVELKGSAGEPRQPLLAVRSAGLFERSLAIFKDVPAGEVQLRLSGEGWQADQQAVTVLRAPGVTTTARPLMARLAATVEIRASIGELTGQTADVSCATLASGSEKQTVPSGQDDPPMLRLFACRANAAEGSRCELVRELPLPVDQPERMVRWSDLAPDRYAAELSRWGVTARSEEWDARVGAKETISLALRPDTVTGRISWGGSPVQATVRFDRSLGRALSDESGSYTAFVTGSPRRSMVTVELCGEGVVYQYAPREPIEKALDIDVPRNALEVRVVDEQRRALAGVRVEGTLLLDDDDSVYATFPFPPTSATGETRRAPVTADARIRVCAVAGAERETACADLVTGHRETRQVELTLPRRQTVRGRLRSAVPFANAVIWRVAASGTVIDAGQVSPAGDFTLKPSAVAGVYFVVVSASHPLALFELPPGGLLDFDMPSSGRSFTISLSPQARKRQFSLETAGRVIPTQALRLHLAMRRLGDIAEPGGTLEFRDIGLDGPLSLYSLPYVTDYPPEWEGLDPIEQPALRATLPRIPVIGAVVRVE